MSAGFTASGKVHRLKVAPEFFEEVQAGRKKAEYRYDDRGFEVGDLIMLVEWTANQQEPGEGVIGRTLFAGITHILNKEVFPQLPERWVVISIQLVESPDLDWQPDKEPELDNVVFLPLVTDGPVEPQKVLRAALKGGLREVVIAGWVGDGRGDLYLASSCDVGELFLLLETAKHDRLAAREREV